MDENLKNKIIETLRGIKNLNGDISHAEARSAILGLISDIRRSE
jgi:hypothetical protein